MHFVESYCPNCNHLNEFPCNNVWRYGSPIVKCHKCQSEYLDDQFREVPIEGIAPKSSKASLYFCLGLVFLAGSLIGTAMIYFHTITPGTYYYDKTIIGTIIEGIASLPCFFMSLRIKLGFQNRSNKNYIQESEERLTNPSYVQKLESYGYKIPEKFKRV